MTTADLLLPSIAPRRDVAAERIRFTVASCSLGLVLVARGEEGVCAVLLGDDGEELARELQRHFPAASLTDGGPDLLAIADDVRAGIDDPRRAIDVPVVLRGTTFQRRVWQRLCEIPVGATATYGEIAVSLGLPTSARAVARACAANRLAVVIPCHRVVRSDGTHSGYRWGAARKAALLARERAT